MSITRISLAALCAVILTSELHAREVVVPNVAGHTVGFGGILWGTELRVTNPTGLSGTVTVKDWIGTAGWQASSFTVPAFSTLSVGGWSLFNPAAYVEDHPEPVFGAVVLEVDDPLIVQSGVLAGPNPDLPQVGPGGGLQCPGWGAGYQYRVNWDGNCNRGSGPIAEAVNGFFAPGAQVDLLWLSTDDDRRTNLTFINPDASSGSFTVHLVSANGATSQDLVVSVPPRGISQISDLFRGPGSNIKGANDAIGASAARARISAPTRFFCIGYVISNANNTAGISWPRQAP